MKNRSWILPAMMAGLLAWPGSLAAHHGGAAYDVQTMTTFTAVVTSFDWRNPHALLHFSVTDEKGTTEGWTAETAGLIILVRAGWERDVLKPGDRIALTPEEAAAWGAYSLRRAPPLSRILVAKLR